MGLTMLAISQPERARLEREDSAAPSRILLNCLAIVARYCATPLSVSQIVHDHLLGPEEIEPSRLVSIAQSYDLRCASVKLDVGNRRKLVRVLPVIVILKDGSAAVLRKMEWGADFSRFTLQYGSAEEERLIEIDEHRFADSWTGRAILVKRNHRLQDEEQPFGLRQIAGLLLRDKKIARDIAIAAILLSFLALTPIMFWRLLVDTVLFYKSFNTFFVLCIVMGFFIVFETIFGHLRRYLTLFIARDVDAKLSTEVFNKLLGLPIDFFESRQTGEITRDMSELWKIRRFLTGELFGTVLDSFVIFVILPILFFFSFLLTCVVLIFALLMVGWLLLMLPTLRRKTGAVFAAEGEKSSYLVETLHGIRTVKSLALDPRRKYDWDVLSARSADLRFEEGRVANLIQTGAAPLERLMTTGVFALAVYLAIATPNLFDVGSLLAFIMLTMRLASPLSRLANLLPEYDEAEFAVHLIGRMVNLPPEDGRGRGGVRAPVVGRVEFKEVRFRYPGTTTPALDGVTFTIEAGTIFGIMGRSGSGKTTITRLLQMLHSNFEGLIKVDGIDLRNMDVDHLRSNIGVVLQENFLFRGSIRETIGAARPEASLAEIVEAAELAGADEFIDRLPKGYDTWIQEGSTNLSGGQRQRLAIARALITKPRILILDEATSALDAESEAIVNANLLRIAKGRTLLIISHRLSSLVGADQILVLERGRVSDLGTHDELMRRSEIYSWLWHQQHRHLQGRAEAAQ
jgi:ATP-binding cassette subfamily B protein